MARVVRVGGKVVIGDEGLAPWLRHTELGRILLNSNYLYTYEPPIDLLPDNAADPCLRWVIGNAFYLIEFRVASAAPAVDLDLPILGTRGGTHRTRYYGKLEGVTPEAKDMVSDAAKRTGLTLHEWLDRAVRERAAADLKK